MNTYTYIGIKDFGGGLIAVEFDRGIIGFGCDGKTTTVFNESSLRTRIENLKKNSDITIEEEKGLSALLEYDIDFTCSMCKKNHPPEEDCAEVSVSALDDFLYTEHDMLTVIEERDHWESKATELAEKYAVVAGIDVGEHSSANCPVQNAIDHAAQFNPSKISMPYE